jgi:hypothetical protein
LDMAVMIEQQESRGGIRSEAVSVSRRRLGRLVLIRVVLLVNGHI